MTEQEALERCDRLINGMSVNNSTCDAFRDEEKGYPTFKKMEEFAEECKSALEKQIAKKPVKKSFIVPYEGINVCPSCKEPLPSSKEHHCKCGQKLDWRNEDEE